MISSIVLMPKKNNNAIRYFLLVDAENFHSLEKLETKMEGFLLKNPYYQQGRSAGQLIKIKCKSIENLNDKIINAYKNQKLIKDGDIKVPEILPLNFISVDE